MVTNTVWYLQKYTLCACFLYSILPISYQKILEYTSSLGLRPRGNCVGVLEFDLDPTLDTSPTLTSYPDETKPDSTSINPTSEATGSAALDQTAPSTTYEISGTPNSGGIYTGPVTITLTGADSESGILKIEYSLDNGQTVQTYTGPFTISASGTTTIQIKSIDNLGNEEIPQTITIQIATLPTPTPTPLSSSAANTDSSSSSNSSSSTGSTSSANQETTSQNSTANIINSPLLSPVYTNSSPASSNDILGITSKELKPIYKGLNTAGLKDLEKKTLEKQKPTNYVKELFEGLLIISGGIITLASAGLLISFLKPPPHKM